MGSLIGGVIGGVGSLIGGSSSKNSGAPALDMTGYNYLTSGAGAPTITQAQNNGNAAGNAAAATQATEAGLLGTGGDPVASNTAFNNYLNSTGYNFQLDQGSRAITGNAASKGLLNSGSTGKALTQYGQNLGGTYFNNYLGQLNNLNTQQSNTAGQGINATVSAGSAGTSGGVAAGNNTQQGANAFGSSIGTAAGAIGGTVANNWDKINSFFG